MFFEDAPARAGAQTSWERYEQRLAAFIADGKPHPRLRHHALWIAHNVVAHPLLGVLPIQQMAEVHKLTSDWLNHKEVDVWHESTPAPQLILRIPAARWCWVLTLSDPTEPS